MKYRRILLKLSGEALAGDRGHGICPEAIGYFAGEVKEILDMDVQVGVVIGGGNIHRGISGVTKGMERTSSDHMGMLATVINSIALRDAFDFVGISTRIMTAVEMNKIAEPYIRGRAIRHLERGRTVIFAGGTGNPYFSTDTAAALRASEIDAGVILKATKVDGIYDKDPETHSDAIKFESLDYIDILNRGIKVMDATAVTLSMENNLEIIVFNSRKKGNLKKVIMGEEVGTLVTRNR